MKKSNKLSAILVLSGLLTSGSVLAQETITGKIGNRPIVSGAHEVDRESMVASVEKELLAVGVNPLSLPSGRYPLTFGTLVTRVILIIDSQQGTYQWESASKLLRLNPANLPGIVFKYMMAQKRLRVLNEPTAASYANTLMSEFSEAKIDLTYVKPGNTEIKLGYERPKLNLKIDSDSIEWGYIDAPTIDGNLVQEMFAIIQARGGFKGKNGGNLVVFHGEDKLSSEKEITTSKANNVEESLALKNASSEAANIDGKTSTDGVTGEIKGSEGLDREALGELASGEGNPSDNNLQHLRPEARIASTTQYTCRLFLDGTMKCVGRNDYGQAPASFRFRKKAIQITVGRDHSCGLLIDGTIQCIGDSGYKRTLDADYPQYRDLSPDAYRFSRRAIQISASEHSTCALLDNGAMECLGSDMNGQAPAHHVFGKPAIQISAGYLHTCALLSDGSIECVGSNLAGEAPARQAYKKRVIRVSAGDGHTCVLFEDGSADCQGMSFHKPMKYHLQYKEPIIDISAGYYLTCALLKSGAVKCVADDHRNFQLKENAVQLAQGGGRVVTLQDGSVLQMENSNEHTNMDLLYEALSPSIR